MLLVTTDGADITTNIVQNSIKVIEQLNNRTNTCVFRTDEQKVSPGDSIEIWEGANLTAQATSGQKDMIVDNVFDFEEKFRVGNEIIIDIDGGNEEKGTIASITVATKTITLVDNLTNTQAIGAKIGRKIFAGVAMTNPEEEIANLGEFTYKVTVTDWVKAFDRKLVADTFEDQFIREIIGRIIFLVIAVDATITLDDLQSAWTESGVARPMLDDPDDRIEGTNSQKTGATGAGTAKWTKTITTQDISSMEQIRAWFKVGSSYGDKASSVKYRVGNDSSNYYEWDSAFVGSDNEDCWHYDNFPIAEPDVIVGTVDLSDIDWLEIEVVATASIPSGNLHFDIIASDTGGFTLQNVIRGDATYSDVRIPYQSSSRVVDDLTKTQSLFWYIDYDKDVHVFKQNANAAPFSLDDSSDNFGNLVIQADISQLKNRQVVKGTEAPSSALYTQDQVADGEATGWYLQFKPKEIEVYVDTGGGFVQKTIGVENLVDETTVDYVYNFQEKTARKGSATSVLNSGDIIRFTYFPFQPIRLQDSDPVSIATMKALVGGDGIFDGAVITDLNIRTFADARARAIAELNAYSNAIITAKFQTDKDGLNAGQIIHITDSSRSIDEDFLIQKMIRTSKQDEVASYQIQASSTLYGLVEFFQFLIKAAGRLQINESEVVDVLLQIDEIMTMADALTLTQKSDIFKTGSKEKFVDAFVNKTGSVSDTGKLDGQWYATYTGAPTATVEFDNASNYNDGYALKLDVSASGASKSVQVNKVFRFPLDASTEYDFRAWVETAIVGGNGLTVRLKEYANETGGSVLATNNLINASTTDHDFEQSEITFTTHASTGYAQIEIILDESTGTASLSNIEVEDTATETVSNPAVSDLCQTA